MVNSKLPSYASHPFCHATLQNRDLKLHPKWFNVLVSWGFKVVIKGIVYFTRITLGAFLHLPGTLAGEREDLDRWLAGEPTGDGDGRSADTDGCMWGDWDADDVE